jgi:hypothetical protein
LGETFAVALELPVILVLAWLACRWIVRRLAVPDSRMPRLSMGATAFFLLFLGELAISITLADRSIAQHLAFYREPPHLLGLAGQILFAAFPILQVRRARHHA